MPIYEYECEESKEGCGYKFEEIQGFNDKVLEKCPKCGKLSLMRLMGCPSFIFKGTGFYTTDYKKPEQQSGSL